MSATATLLSQLVQTRGAIDRITSGAFTPFRSDALERHEIKMESLLFLLPSGSGFDAGTEVESLTDEKAVFTTAYHHMNEHGYYDGWTHHKVIVKANFTGLDIRVTGRDRNGIKDFIAETFMNALSTELPVVW